MEVVRVLLVDDQRAFLRAMASVVEETRGFLSVGAAVSGEECLLLAEALRPDLVLLDVNLPGIDGVETAKLLGRQAVRRSSCCSRPTTRTPASVSWPSPARRRT